MKLVVLLSISYLASGCAGFPVFRCAFDTRPDELGFNECWENQKRPENTVCFDDWKKYGTYKNCIETADKNVVASAEPELQGTDENGVKDCKYLGTFRGSSFMAGQIGSEMGLQSSKEEAKDKAKEYGATHFVLKDQVASAGYTKTSVSIKAYDCASKQAH